MVEETTTGDLHLSKSKTTSIMKEVILWENIY